MRKALFAALLFVLIVTVGCSTSSTGAGSAPGPNSSLASAAGGPSVASAASESNVASASAPTMAPATVAQLDPTSTATRVLPVPSATSVISAEASVTPTVIATDTTPTGDDPAAAPGTTKAALTTPVFVFFYADWCNVCTAMRPLVDQLKVQYSNRIQFAYLNVDEPEGKKAAASFRVWAIPFFVLAKPDGKIVGQWVGQQADAVFPTAFDELLKSTGS